MILFSKKTALLIFPLILFFIFPLFCISFFANTEGLWFSNIFYDRLFVMILASMFTIGISIIDKSISPIVIIRSKSRGNALRFQLIQQYLFALIYLTIWFSVVLIVTKVYFGAITVLSLFQILDWLVRYFLGFVIIINISIIFKSLRIKLLSSSPYICVYIILAAEVLAIVPLLPFRFYFIFSWIFNNNPISYFVLALIIFITLLIQKCYVVNADIY